MALPAAAIGVVTALASAATFLYLTFASGSVDIYLPQQIAVKTSSPQWEFAINTSFVNTAPPNNLKIVENARAAIRFVTGQTETVHTCEWHWTTELIPTADYEQRYKDLYKRLPKQQRALPDQFAPRHRKAPFRLHGRQLQAKTLLLECPEIDAKTASSTRVGVKVNVTTPDRPYDSPERVYDLTQEAVRNSRTYLSWEWLSSR